VWGKMVKKIKKWEPEEFELEMNTVWSFPDRGKWATHDAKYRGNWSPYIPRNLLLRYSHEGDLVLDQFVGGGTTLVEAKLLNRNIIGVDVNNESLNRCREKCNFEYENSGEVYFYEGDARNLSFIPDENIDFICTHPPYANIIKYSENIENDLSQLKVKDFLIEMEKVALESYRVLKKDKFCAILMGDTRQKGHIVPMSFEVMKIFEKAGFRTKEIIIKEQHNCRATGFWKTNSVKYNFLLIAHEYLFVFKK
jgi:putative RNA methylase